MKTIKITLGSLLLAISIVSCTPNPTPTPTPTPLACATTSSDFQSLYSATLASNSVFTNITTMDLVTHEYTFTLSANKNVCSIGYQGNATLFSASIPYTIEIYDNTSSSMTYTGNHLFNSAFTDYVTPLSTVNLVAGHSYTIRRKATNYLSNIGNTIGRIIRFSPALPSYPYTSGVLTITGSNFYGSGGPVLNYGIPYIDMILQ